MGGFEGGGMMMDPRRNPPGMAGPRFDPVFPGMPNPGIFPGNPGGLGIQPRGPRRNFGDELPPPGYDDMFM